jgi:predicted nucleic acid-binding protein
MSTASGFVLDPSTALAWCFPDEHAAYPQSVLDSLATGQALVPSLWPLEIANAFLMVERRGRSTQANTVNWTTYLASVPIAIDDETNAHAWSNTLNLARVHGLTSYDAAYLELALRKGLPLATLDQKLRAAAVAVGVPLYQVTP